MNSPVAGWMWCILLVSLVLLQPDRPDCSSHQHIHQVRILRSRNAESEQARHWAAIRTIEDDPDSSASQCTQLMDWCRYPYPSSSNVHPLQSSSPLESL